MTTIETVAVPDSKLCNEITELVRDTEPELLFNHSSRVYYFGALTGLRRGLRFDRELLYAGAMFHDMGLTPEYGTQTERFEVDGANAARQFLASHNVPEEQVETVWQAIALHTTPGVTHYMRPEVALLNSGVLLDVLGKGYDQFPSDLRDEIVARYPRRNFKQDFIKAYFAGFANKPWTTYGTVNASICERFIPGYKTPNSVDVMAASPFPDSE
jgi:HD domain